MLSVQDHDDLVSRFFASAVGEAPWAQTLETMASRFGSSGTIFGLHQPDSAVVVTMESHNYPRDFLAAYFDSEIYAKDPRMAHVLRVPRGQVYHDESMYDVREMERNGWVKASLEILGVFDLAGVAISLPDGGAARLAMLRTRREGRISAEAVAAFSRLVPQVERACALGHAIECEAGSRAMLLETLAGKTDGLVLLDRLGGALFMNEAAGRMLRAGDGLSIQAGQFVTRRPPETRRLQQMLREALRGFGVPGTSAGGQMLVSRSGGRRPFLVSILPTPARETFLTGPGIVCVVRIKDLDAPPIPEAASLARLFGLSIRESDLAAQLVRFARLDEAATHCGMAVNTARNHLQSIFRKTGVSSQAEAVQLFGRLPAE